MMKQHQTAAQASAKETQHENRQQKQSKCPDCGETDRATAPDGSECCASCGLQMTDNATHQLQIEPCETSYSDSGRRSTTGLRVPLQRNLILSLPKSASSINSASSSSSQMKTNTNTNTNSNPSYQIAQAPVSLPSDLPFPQDRSSDLTDENAALGPESALMSSSASCRLLRKHAMRVATLLSFTSTLRTRMLQFLHTAVSHGSHRGRSAPIVAAAIAVIVCREAEKPCTIAHAASLADAPLRSVGRAMIAFQKTLSPWIVRTVNEQQEQPMPNAQEGSDGMNLQQHRSTTRPHGQISSRAMMSQVERILQIILEKKCVGSQSGKGFSAAKKRSLDAMHGRVVATQVGEDGGNVEDDDGLSTARNAKRIQIAKQILRLVVIAQSCFIVEGRHPAPVISAAVQIVLKAHDLWQDELFGILESELHVTRRTVSLRVIDLRRILLQLGQQLPWGKDIHSRNLTLHTTYIVNNLHWIYPSTAANPTATPPSFAAASKEKARLRDIVLRARQRINQWLSDRPTVASAISVCESNPITPFHHPNSPAAHENRQRIEPARCMEDIDVECLLLQGVPEHRILELGIQSAARSLEPAVDEESIDKSAEEYIRTREQMGEWSELVRLSDQYAEPIRIDAENSQSEIGKNVDDEKGDVGVVGDVNEEQSMGKTGAVSATKKRKVARKSRVDHSALLPTSATGEGMDASLPTQIPEGLMRLLMKNKGSSASDAPDVE